jgi:hypothetical protein
VIVHFSTTENVVDDEDRKLEIMEQFFKDPACRVKIDDQAFLITDGSFVYKDYEFTYHCYAYEKQSTGGAAVTHVFEYKGLFTIKQAISFLTMRNDDPVYKQIMSYIEHSKKIALIQ